MHKWAQYWLGSVRFSILGGRGEDFFNACVAQGLPVQSIEPTPLGYDATVPLRSFMQLHKLARQYRCRLHIIEKNGVYFKWRTYRNRKGILAGALACALFLLCTHNMIWNICFYDFTPEQERALRTMLYEKEICEGALYHQDAIHNAQSEIFVETTAYGWLCMNFKSGKLTIEKLDASMHAPMQTQAVTDIIATTQGVIERIDVQGGFVRVVVGQAVAQGDLLVSGVNVGNTQVPFYTQSNAKIYANITRRCTVFQPYQAQSTQAEGEAKRYYDVKLLGKVIPLHGVIDTQGVQVEQVQYPLTLGAFIFPVTIQETQVRALRQTQVTYTQKQAEDLARLHIYDTLKTMFPDSTYLNQTETITQTEEGVTVQMDVTLLADIGVTVPFTGMGMPEIDKKSIE